MGTAEHKLTGHFPTEVVKTFEMDADGSIEENVTGQQHRPGHLSGNRISCSCGKDWEGVEAEEKAKEHLKRATAVNQIKERYEGTEYRGWKLYYDNQARTLYWSYEESDGVPLSIYATPFYEGEEGIAVQCHNVGGEELVVKNLAAGYRTEEIVEEYVDIVTSYIDRNWMTEEDGGAE